MNLSRRNVYILELIFNGPDLVGYVLSDIYRKMCHNGIDEFINITNDVKTESLTHFIKY